MAIDPERLLALEIPVREQSFGWRDTVLYALGLGFGLDPTDGRQLRFVDETRLQAVPTMVNVLGYPGFWARDLDTGIDWLRLVHGEQSMRIHRPLPTSGVVEGRTRVVDIVDKGAGKGALVYSERLISDKATGDTLATLLQSYFCRGDGGFGGRAETSRKPHMTPERTPDLTLDLPTHPQLGLIYRLSGDLNPLHSDPAVAAKAGFDRPILHGLATYGIAGHALLALLCDYDPARLRSMDARFSAPMFPGETVSVDVWREGEGTAVFRARVASRGVVVISNGLCEYGG